MIALIVTMTIVMGATINSLINDIAITPRATNTIVIASIGACRDARQIWFRFLCFGMFVCLQQHWLEHLC